jgi:hypothetical protein
MGSDALYGYSLGWGQPHRCADISDSDAIARDYWAMGQLSVRRSIWRGREQEPKTSNAIRAVDIPETLACVVRSYVAGISGYLFATAQGNPLQQRNVLRVLHGVKRVGLHAFRRFRLTWLRKNGVPKDLERYWMGHAPEEVGDLYSKLKEDVAFRQIWVERTGLGFELVHVGPQNAAAVETATVA